MDIDYNLNPTLLRMKFLYEFRLLCLLGLCIIFGVNPIHVHAQSRRITGTITDGSSGSPLVGATALVKGTTQGAISGSDGSFSLFVEANEDTLEVSYIGFTTQLISIGNSSEFLIQMLADDAYLDEVVVVGYGTQNRSDVTGAVASIKPENFNQGVVTSVNALLQGKVAGLSISKPGGDPTRGSSIQLRGPSTLSGATEPFYVIDGIPGISLSTVAPEDILSIDVAKDASSTAIYGTRAANGVIFVTTRKGQAGKAFMDYHGYVSTTAVSRYVDVANSTQLKGYLSSVGLSLEAKDDLGFDTDWQEEITQTALAQNHNLSFGGGSSKSRYYASLTYTEQEGVVLTSDQQIFRGRIRVDNTLWDDRLQINLTLAASHINNQEVDYNAFYASMRYLPTVPVRLEDGSFFRDIPRQEYNNPVAVLLDNDQNRKFTALTFYTNASFKILKGLTFNLNSTLERRDELFSQYQNREHYTAFNTGGLAQRGSYAGGKELIETYLNYETKLGEDHGLNLLAGYSYEENFFNDGVQARNVEFLSDDLGFYGLGIGNTPDGFNTLQGIRGFSDRKLISFYGRAIYTYDERITLQASLRRDGSSVFGENNKWAIFPAVAASWNLASEDFLVSSPVSTLKLRAGWGVSGNQGIPPYQSQTIFSPQGRVFLDGTWINSFFINRNPNPDLKWEETATTNLGIEFGFLNDRINGSIDLYDKNTVDLLGTYPVPVPPFAVDDILANVGEMNNRGIEVYVSAALVQKENFTWTSGINFAHNRNEVVSLSNSLFEREEILTGEPSGQGIVGQTVQVLRPGLPIGSFYLLDFVGTDGNGAHLFATRDGQNVTVSDVQFPADNVLLGNGLPDFTFGWTHTFTMGNFGLNFLLRGVSGNKVLNALSANLARLPEAQIYNQSAAAIEGRNPDNPVHSDFYLENGSYIRLDNATLSYDIPLSASFLGGAKVYVTGQNLFTITDYSGLDPEINLNTLTPGIDGIRNDDRNYYPVRTFTAGLRLSLK